MLKDRIIYSVAILCGGKSARMGRDKALLKWHGTTLLEHIANGFQNCDDLFLSVRDAQQYPDLPYRKVCDRIPDCGPLGGLCASLEASRHEILFVTTCDAPMVDERTADLLADALQDHDCVIPFSGDIDDRSKLHPLVAVYKKSVLATALKHLQQKDFRIRPLFSDIDTLYFPEDKLPQKALTLTNLNTPRDFQSFLEI